MPPSPRYLYAVLAGHDFQEGVKNYRDLVYLNGTLDLWDDSMGAFQDMIETREKAYAERLPRADALLASGDRRGSCSSAMSRSRTSCAASKRSTTSRRWAPSAEREQWARIQRVEAGSRAPRTRLKTPSCARAWRWSRACCSSGSTTPTGRACGRSTAG